MRWRFQNISTVSTNNSDDGAPVGVIVGVAIAAVVVLLLGFIVYRHNQKKIKTSRANLKSTTTATTAAELAGVSNFINPPGAWDFFLSHTQRDANAVVLASELYSNLTNAGACAS